MGMENMTLVHTTHTENLMAMTNAQLEAWFGAGGLTVQVVENCTDPDCVNCITLDQAQQAA